jgi:hypothetical protein
MRKAAHFIISLSIVLLCSALPIGNAAGAPAPLNAGEPSWFIDMNDFSRSAHAALDCEKCHGDMIVNGKKHPDEKIPGFLKKNIVRTFDYTRCEVCHRESYRRYLTGEHAKALQKELEDAAEGKKPDPNKIKAPVCGDCHSPHYGKSGLSRVEIGRRMTESCATCHPAQTAAYLKNYHGRTAVLLGYDKSAYCTDCHGTHDCVSLKNKKDALAACQRCHPEAETRFTEFVIHDTMVGVAGKDKDKKERVTIINTVRTIAVIGVCLILAFFLVHTLLWMLREIHEKLRKH